MTEERFIFALGSGGNSRKISWCDREDRNQWTPAATNEAGDIELQTSGQIMQAIRTRGQTFILTDTDAHTARYQGPPYVYGFERVGTSCGTVTSRGAVDTDRGVFFIGQENFFLFNGNTVQTIKCDVHDYIFGDINTSRQTKIWAMGIPQYGEVWWFYPSANSIEIDRYVAYDYNENHWMIGELSRTSGVQRGVFRYPMMANWDTTHANIKEHEVGYNVDNGAIFAETGPISAGTGENIMYVTSVIPDEVTQGDVSMTFKTRYHPNDTETSHGPFTPANPTDARFSGRQVRMRVTGARPADWRVGIMRLEATIGYTLMPAPILPVISQDLSQWGRQLTNYLQRNLGKLYFKSSDDNPSENGVILWMKLKNMQLCLAIMLFDNLQQNNPHQVQTLVVQAM